MTKPLFHWLGLYESLKFSALCLDIETTGFNGKVAVVGLCGPSDGEVGYQEFVRGRYLDASSLARTFRGCKLLITFNGLSFDVPRIRKEFPTALPRVPHVDLFRVAREFYGMPVSLKTLETTFNIRRADDGDLRKGMATKLWRRFEEHNDENALRKLLNYNREDAANLYMLADALLEQVRKKVPARKASVQQKLIVEEPVPVVDDEPSVEDMEGFFLRVA